MAAQITNYQCPACTGPLQFDAATGKLACQYCGSAYAPQEIEALYAEKDAKAAETKAAADAKREKAAASGSDEWDMSGLSSDWGADANGMRTYNCPSCCAELICDETTAVTACPYCGNPSVVPGQLSGVLKPDFVIPFKVTKEKAIAALKEHYKGRPFLPNAFKQKNHLEEIKGVYVPFWLFDGTADCDAVYDCEKTHTYRSGDYDVIHTDHFEVLREGSVSFSRIPVDGSTKMPDDYMDSIEPFDYGALKEFSTGYMPGYMADKYDVSAEECSERADARAENTAEQCLRDSVINYSSVLERRKNIRLHRGEVKYALLPVWLLTTKWNGENWLFAMNGQTGKFVGKLPVDKKKKWGIFAAVYAAAAAVSAVFWLFPGGLLNLLGL